MGIEVKNVVVAVYSVSGFWLRKGAFKGGKARLALRPHLFQFAFMTFLVRLVQF